MPDALKDASPKRLAVMKKQAKLLAAMRAAAGEPQTRTAERLGVKHQTYLSWEHGRRQPSAAMRAKIREVYGVELPGLGTGTTPRCPHCGRIY